MTDDGTKKPSLGCALEDLAAAIEARRNASPEESYTAKMLSGDEDSLLKKIVEEAGEAALAAKGGDPSRLTAELADLHYHCLLAMARYNVSLDAVAAELRSRRGRSGIAEKSARKET